MKNKLKVIFVATLITVSCLMSTTSNVSASGFKDQACDAAGTAQITNCNASGNDAAAQTFAGSLAEKIVSTLSIIIGVVGVIMLMLGGFKYVTSSGESAGLKSAKDTIIYALVGLVVALFAQVIARFVLSNIK